MYFLCVISVSNWNGESTELAKKAPLLLTLLWQLKIFSIGMRFVLFCFVFLEKERGNEELFSLIYF